MHYPRSPDMYTCVYYLRFSTLSLIHADFQPQLMMMEVVQSFSGRLCTLTYELAGYTEGVAKYPNCAGQFSVNFTVSPVADVRNMTTGSIAQYNVTNLERCTVYDISGVASGDVFLYSITNLEMCAIYDTFARSYRGGQLLGTTYAAVSVMISKQCW